MKPNLKVSVCMITYGHENYICQAIEGVLMQECDFEIELVLVNDCSPDGTDEVIQQIMKDHPRSSIINYIKHEKNLGMMPNFIFALQQCKGEYIALCEGDDYWTNSLKLKKQVNFLENNSQFSLCFHNAVSKSGTNEKIMLQKLYKDVFGTNDILCQWFIPTASIVYKNYADFIIPDWFVNCQSGDIPLLLLLSQRGNFKYINEIMSIYRVHEGGISNTHREYSKVVGMIYIYQSFNFYTNLVYDKKIREAIVYEIQCHLPEIQELKYLKRLKNNIFRRVLKKLNNKVIKFFN